MYWYYKKFGSKEILSEKQVFGKKLCRINEVRLYAHGIRLKQLCVSFNKNQSASPNNIPNKKNK